MRKFIRRVQIFATIVATFAATFAPGIIRAAFVPPAAMGAQNQATGTGAGSTPTMAPLTAATAVPAPLYLRVTAYSSSPNETDDTPFITASGLHVRDGIVATNLLPFGTKIQIPSLFGDKVFTVEDRMAKRMKDVVDVWMVSKTAALKFGVSYAKIVVVASTSTAAANLAIVADKAISQN